MILKTEEKKSFFSKYGAWTGIENTCRYSHSRWKKVDSCQCCWVIKCSEEVSTRDVNNALWFVALSPMILHIPPYNHLGVLFVAMVVAVVVVVSWTITCLQLSTFISLFSACRIWEPSIIFPATLSLLFLVYTIDNFSVQCFSQEPCLPAVYVMWIRCISKETDHREFLDNPISVGGFCGDFWALLWIKYLISTKSPVSDWNVSDLFIFPRQQGKVVQLELGLCLPLRFDWQANFLVRWRTLKASGTR